MTSESKILTVSYGTFSCTLEGFDNPFDTMKAIAEYFRDLAAQDRHFGAEPPPPDAAMLHRLAEREVSRLAGQRDETARLQMPGAPVDLTGDAAPAKAPRIQINPVPRRPGAATEELEPEVEGPAAAPEPSLQDVIPDGVAAKLARIRRSVSPAAEAAAFVGSEALADSAAEAEGFDEFVPAGDVEAPAGLDADAAAVADGTDDGLDDDAVTAIDMAAEAAAEPEPSLAEASAAVAARLGALIASAPAEGATIATDDALAADDWSAEPVDEAAAVAFEDSTEAAPFVDLDAEAASEAVAEADLAPAEDLDAPAAETVAVPDEPVFDAAEADLPVEAEAMAALAEKIDPPVEEFTSADEDLELVAALDGVNLARAEYAEPEELPVHDPVVEDVAFDSPVEDLSAERSGDDAFGEPVAAEDAGVDLVAEAAPEVAEPAPEVEEPVAAPRLNNRAKRVSSRIVRIHPDEDEDLPAARDLAATRVVSSSDESDEIARLMQQAEEVMAEDENRRRQEALSRLKAAVVATEADRADIDYEAPRHEADLDPYRDDLAEAIQPLAPAEPEPEPEVKPVRRKSVTIRPATEPRPGTIRPGMISPPPLVLVSEQRIDRTPPPGTPAVAPAPAAATAAPQPAAPSYSAPAAFAAGSEPQQPMVGLRTGRLSGAIGAGAAMATSSLPAQNIVLDKPSYGTASETEEDEDLGEDSKEINEAGLAAFAEMVGARSMAEMLEAAAAYATCVEKRSQFTRPQLMRRMMASAGGRPVSREDGLRSFGTLLRTGRIEKVTRGHYTLAETSPYLAEARRLG